MSQQEHHDVPKIDRASAERITIREFIDAVFFNPAHDQDKRVEPVNKPTSPTTESAPATPFDFESLYQPTQLLPCPQMINAKENGETIQIVSFLIGTTTALFTGSAGIITLQSGGGFTGWLLLITSIAIWISLIVLDIAPPDGALLKRGPIINGPATARLDRETAPNQTIIRTLLGLTGLALALIAFILAGDNELTIVLAALTLASIITLLISFSTQPVESTWEQIRHTISPPYPIDLRTLAAMMVILAAAVTLRLIQLDSLPANMVSEHVEYILIAADGISPLYATSNGGREPLWVWLIQAASGATPSFLTLKVMSVIVGTGVIITGYALGKTLLDSVAGLVTATLLAISWWAILFSRMGLHHILGTLVAALLLVSLTQAIRLGGRRWWLLSGILAGVALYSHESMRIAPVMVFAAWLFAIAGPTTGLIRAARNERSALLEMITLQNQSQNTLAAFAVMAAVAAPLLRIMISEPELYWNAYTSRLLNLNSTAFSIMQSNLLPSMGMYLWRSDSSWFNGPTGMAALSVMTGVFLVLGVVAWLFRIAVHRKSEDAFLPVALLLLLLPSTAAGSAEIPNFARAAVTLVPIMLLAAYPLTLLLGRWKGLVKPGIVQTGTAGVLATVLLAVILIPNAVAVFSTYWASYEENTWDHSLIAETARQMTESDGDIWVMGWPYWIDYRAIGIELGEIPFTNYSFDSAALLSVFTDQPELVGERPMVFVVHKDDINTLNLLNSLFTADSIITDTSLERSEQTVFIIIQAAE